MKPIQLFYFLLINNQVLMIQHTITRTIVVIPRKKIASEQESYIILNTIPSMQKPHNNIPSILIPYLNIYFMILNHIISINNSILTSELFNFFYIHHTNYQFSDIIQQKMQIQETASSILCALCGMRFTPTSGSICPTCTIKSIQQIQILHGDVLNFCRYCNRYERPPWIHCQRESQEMMAILLKKIKGLNKVQFQSANFVWTEQHSKRIKLKVTYMRQVNDKMKLQCVQVVQFVEKYTQCPDCRKKFTPHDWVAAVQIRQFANHKKTILNLEQILLKNKLSQKFLKTEPLKNGIDVFFSNEHEAHKLVDFLKSRYPTSVKNSKQLISHNEQNNTSVMKNTFSVIIPKICKDDLIKIPPKLAKQLGSCSLALYCIKVSSVMYFVDVTNFKKVQINSTQYVKYEGLIEIFPLKIYAKKFNLLDCQISEKQSIHKVGTYELTIMKQNQFQTIFTISLLTDQPGRDVLGFQIKDMEGLEGIKDLPQYFITQKIKDKQQKKKNRARKRQKLAKQRIQAEEKSRLSQIPKQEQIQEQQEDQEQFGQEQWEDQSEQSDQQK